LQDYTQRRPKCHLISTAISGRIILGTIYEILTTGNEKMAKQEYSAYQKSVITNYYNNRSDIALSKLSELVSELFLADTDAKRDRLWERAHKAMVNLKIPPAIIDHIMAKKDVKILAKNLNEWLAKAK
jgi:hypothetical protein